MTVTVSAPRGGVPLAAIQARGPRRAALALLGPAFVASVAYVDPGNFAAHFAAGAEHGYALVWVIVMSNLMALLVQYLTSKVGLATGRSLPELCRGHYGRRVNILLWLQAEIVAIATDLAEFVGAAVGLNLLFGLPLFAAGMVTAVLAFGILALEQRGYRKFELAIIALLRICRRGVRLRVLRRRRSALWPTRRRADPRISGGDSLSLAVGIIGATVMPHVVYLHSALHTNRVHADGAQQRRTLLGLWVGLCLRIRFAG